MPHPRLLPEDQRDAPVAICPELPSNESPSVTYSAHQIAAEVIRYHKLGVSPVWIEHYPKEATDGTSETFELVAFSGYDVNKERDPSLRETRLTIGEPTRKTLDRESVEVLVGQEVYALTGKRDAPFTELQVEDVLWEPRGAGPRGVCGTDERAARWVGEGIT
jgi:hypothetical protein